MLLVVECGGVGSEFESCSLVVNIVVGLHFWTRNTDVCGAPSKAGAFAPVRAPVALRMGDAAVSSPTNTVAGGWHPCCGMVGHTF